MFCAVLCCVVAVQAITPLMEELVSAPKLYCINCTATNVPLQESGQRQLKVYATASVSSTCLALQVGCWWGGVDGKCRWEVQVGCVGGGCR